MSALWPKAETDPQATPELAGHIARTQDVHGIPDTSVLVTAGQLEARATQAEELVAGALGTHVADTQDVHGIPDTSTLVFTDDPRLTDSRTPLPHTHLVIDVAGLQGQLDGRVTLSPTTSARNVIVSQGASAVPLALRPAVGQTANQQEWQDTSGGTVSWVSAAGAIIGNASPGGFYVTAGEAFSRSNFGGASMDFGPGTAARDIEVARVGAGLMRLQGKGAATNTTLVVKGIAAQPGNLQEWQDGAGAVLAKVDASGHLTTARAYVSKLRSMTNSPTVERVDIDSNSYSMLVSSVASGATGLIVKAATSQTGDLQQWQGSTGSQIAYLGAGGNLGLVTGRLLVGNTDYSARVNVTPTSASQVPVAVRGAALQTADFQQWQDSTGNLLAKIDKSGFYWGFNPGTGLTDQQVSLGPNNLRFYRNSASYISQSGTGGMLAFQTRDTAGTTDMTRVSIMSGDAATASHSLSGGNWRADAPAADKSAFEMRGATGQTADIAQFTVSGVGPRATVGANGKWRGRGLVVSPNSTPSDPGDRFLIQAQGDFPASVAGTAVYGMQMSAQVKNPVPSYAALWSRVQADGAIGVDNAYGLAIQSPLLTGGATTLNTYGIKIEQQNATGASNVFGIHSRSVIHSEASSAGIIPFVSRGAISQSGDLFQFQDSAAAVLSSVSADGGFRAPNNNGFTFRSRPTDGLASNGSGALLFNIGGVSKFTIDATGPYFNTNAIRGGNGISVIDLISNASAVNRVAIENAATGGSAQVRATGNDADVLLLVRGKGAKGVQVESTATSSVALVAKGFIGQTADLQQWQSSTGSPSAWIGSSGFIRTTSYVSANSLVEARTGTSAARVAIGTSATDAEMQFQTDTTLRRVSAGVIAINEAGGGLRLKSPDGLITRTLSIDNSGTLVVA